MTGENAFNTDILNCNYHATRIISQVVPRTSILERVNLEGQFHLYIS